MSRVGCVKTGPLDRSLSAVAGARNAAARCPAAAAAGASAEVNAGLVSCIHVLRARESGTVL